MTDGGAASYLRFVGKVCKVVSLAMAGILVVAFLLVSVIAIYLKIDKEDAFFVKNAIEIDPDFLGCFDVHVQATIELSCPMGRDGSEVVDVKFRARRLACNDLTPWLGSRGSHVYHETYRR